MSDLDRKNAEDMVLIAIECLYEIKIYEFSVFNPVNFQIIAMCQFALQYFPESIPLYMWLLKMYAKLGLSSLVTDLSLRLPSSMQEDANYQRLGAQRFSVYTDFGAGNYLDELNTQYKDYFKDRIMLNMNNIVNYYEMKDFEEVHPLMTKNEILGQSGLQHAVGLAYTL